jgi:hypothetical protein
VVADEAANFGLTGSDGVAGNRDVDLAVIIAEVTI